VVEEEGTVFVDVKVVLGGTGAGGEDTEEVLASGPWLQVPGGFLPRQGLCTCTPDAPPRPGVPC